MTAVLRGDRAAHHRHPTADLATSHQPVTEPEGTRPVTRLARTTHPTSPVDVELRRYLVELAASGTPVPWTVFVDHCWYELARRRPHDAPPAGWDDVRTAWRVTRRYVFEALDELPGLSCSVWCTGNGTQQLREHPTDQAGLVVVHAGELDGTLPAPRVELPGAVGATEEAYRRRMAERHGLIPHPGLPTTLREFLGQHADYRSATWLDHVHGWLDQQGEPVLTAEPYADAFGEEAALRAVDDLHGLPLRIERHAGVWVGGEHGTVLLVLRPGWDSLPAVVPAPEPPAELTARQRREVDTLTWRLLHAEGIASKQLRTELRKPDHRSLRGLVATVLANPSALQWAAVQLGRQACAGYQTAPQAEYLFRHVFDALPEGAFVRRPPVESYWWGGYIDAYRQTMGEASADVLAELRPDWSTRMRTALSWPGIEEHPYFLHLLMAAEWLDDLHISEVYG